MFVRVLVAALAAFALASGAAAQTTPTCPPLTTFETCTSSEFSSTSATTDGSTYLSIGFNYCAPNVGYGVGQILSLQANGVFTVNNGLNTLTSQVAYPVTGLTGFITTAQPGTVTALNPLTTLGSQQAAILAFNDGTTAAQITIQTNPNAPAGTPATFATVSIGSNAPNVINAGITLPFAVPAIIPSTQLQVLNNVVQDSCSAIRGDPLFAGFRGQQFYVGGEDGQVMNMIATFNMQLNGRFINMEEGAAIKPAEQEKARLLSLVRHQEQPEVPAFPRTTAWSHPGNYFGEAGVALVDDNRVYVKAGQYATGFAKVALNGRPLSVSNDFVVLGSGVNTTYVQRVSAHEVMIRTINVEFTLTNSDNFLNVEQVHLERGFRQHNRFDGLLGKSVDAKWSWNSEDEKAAVVQNNDLFARTVMEA